jgi:pyruvate dehydrogenase E2 component (dihydrolipoamide acetyltransferase)
MLDFRMPALGADMEAGTLLEWRIQAGQTVHRGDIVAVVDTEKAAIDVEIWMDGVVEQLMIQPGTKVPVGTVLAIIRGTGPAAEAGPVAAVPAPQMPKTPAPQIGRGPAPDLPGHVHVTPWARRLAQDLGVDLAKVQGTGPGGAIEHTDVERAAGKGAAPGPGAPAAQAAGAAEERLRISPAARRRARELGVDLTTVQAATPGGAVTLADVERAALKPAAAAEPAPAPPPAAPAPLKGAERAQAMRKAIAAAMTRSKREIPHYYLGLEIDLTRLLAWLEAGNQKRSIVDRLVYAVLLIKAVALAVKEVPEMNGFWRNDRFEPSAAVHPGIAISLRGGGLVAPALRNADEKPVGQLMQEMRDLVNRARSYSLRSSEMSDPTLTITNLGEQGVDQVFGVIFPPQVALVGFGRVSAQRRISASLAADHRASDGHRGGLFLSAVDRRLQTPEAL